MNALFELAKLTEEVNLAINWLGKVLTHPATQKETYNQAEEMLDTLRHSVPENILEEQLKVGEKADVKELVESILEATSNDEE